MKKTLQKIVSFLTTAALTASLGAAVLSTPVFAAESAKQMEYLGRGLTAVKVNGGIYLSWRLLGTESLDQKYDIYRDGIKITTVDATNYTDNGGFTYNTYNVVPEGETPYSAENAQVWQNNYIDIPLDRPNGGVTPSGEAYTYSVNDTSVGDIDGDGEYEYIVKWDPSNSKDNSSHGYTGNVLLDCYKLDGTKLWRVDLGVNIRAGAHYTQFIVYDFDGDGKAEMALRTAPGSKDGNGNYVSDAGTNLTWDGYNNSSDLRQGGSKSGHIIKGPDWLTMFNGETGAAMQTIDYYPQRGSVKGWGDSYGGRSERFLAGVAYLDGQTPSLIMCRGYYEKAAMAAFDWNGSSFTQRWGKTYTSKSSSSLYGQGAHSLSVADVDNDGCDEIIFGSAVMDHDGNVLNSTGHGHGDALHVSDFNNDGEQEIMMTHEDKAYYRTWGAELRKGKNAAIMASVASSSDVGRGVISNIDDDYAQTNTNALSMFYSSANTNIYDLSGNIIQKTRTIKAQDTVVTETVNAVRPADYNFFVYWDGDLGRELLDRNRITKYVMGTDEVDARTDRLETFSGIHSNNSSKATPALSADLFGDWREEIAYGTDDNKALRIFTSITPTDYKLTTLMHDSQYRCAIAWQNVGYNQPPHTSYYVGSQALASNKNYLAPATGFDSIAYANIPEKQEIISDVEETTIYTTDSFDNGPGFTGGTQVSLDAPYNNAVSIASSGSLDFGFTTPDPNATPTPKPTAAPTAAPEPKPIPEKSPVPVHSNDFNSLNTGTLVNLQSANTTYTDIEGMTLVTGGRSSDGTTTNWSIQTGGVSGNALVLNSGKYCNTRGPRIGFTTPTIPDGGSAEMSINVKLYATGTDAAVLRYNDDINNVTTASDISQYFNTSNYKTFKTVIKNNGGTYTRTLYSDDTIIASDNTASFPVLLGILTSGTASSGTGVYFDNYMSGVTEPSATVITAKSFSMNNDKSSAEVYNYTNNSVTVSLMTAAYDESSSLSNIEITDVELPSQNFVSVSTNAVTIPENGYSRAFLWEKETQSPIADSLSSKTPLLMSEPTDESIILNSSSDSAAFANELNADGTYKVSFDWRPGTSVALQNASGENLVALTKASGGAIKYKTGNNTEKTISTLFTDSSHWYHADITIDFTSKTADIALMDYTSNSAVKNIYSASFGGVGGFISKMVVSGATYLDNLTINDIKYNVDMSLVNISVTDESGAAISDAIVSIGSRKLITDADGQSAIKLKSGDYSYSITKEAYKSQRGQIVAENKQDVNISESLRAGELRNVYVSYVYNQDVEIHEPVLAGTASENTTYSVPDSGKTDVKYTFPSDVEDIIPGYEDYSGQNYTFEYDPDNSSTVNVTVEENYDTYIKLAYKIKRIPEESDTEVVRVNMSEDGVGRSNWNANSYEFAQEEETGIKYTQFTNIGQNPVTISFTNKSDKLVMEYDIMYKDMDWGGQYYGMIPYNGTTAGLGFGLRTSSEANNQWEWGYYQAKKDNYLAKDADASIKYYTASNIWRDKWAHVIAVCTGSEIRVTAVVKDSNKVIIRDQPVPLSQNVGTSSRPINKVVFTKIQGSGDATVGISNFKAYTVGVASGGEVAQSEVSIKPQDTKDFAAGTHISECEGVEFDVSDIIGASYEIQDENGNTVTPAGFAVTSDGIFTVDVESLDNMPQYYVVVKYNNTIAKKIKLNYLSKTLVNAATYEFTSGTSPFTITSKSGFGVSNSNGTLCYTRTSGTGTDSGVWLNATVWSGDLADDFIFSYDYMVETAFYKGYLYLQDGSGKNMVKGETHVDEPRIKFFTPTVSGSSTAGFASPNFAKNSWYTFVYDCTNMNTSNAQITLNIYNKGDYSYSDDTASADPIMSIPFTPDSHTGKGLVIKNQVAQGSGKHTTDEGDKQYFDNMSYCYYDYQ